MPKDLLHVYDLSTGKDRIIYAGPVDQFGWHNSRSAVVLWSRRGQIPTNTDPQTIMTVALDGRARQIYSDCSPRLQLDYLLSYGGEAYFVERVDYAMLDGYGGGPPPDDATTFRTDDTGSGLVRVTSFGAIRRTLAPSIRRKLPPRTQFSYIGDVFDGGLVTLSLNSPVDRASGDPQAQSVILGVLRLKDIHVIETYDIPSHWSGFAATAADFDRTGRRYLQTSWPSPNQRRAAYWICEVDTRTGKRHPLVKSSLPGAFASQIGYVGDQGDFLYLESRELPNGDVLSGQVMLYRRAKGLSEPVIKAEDIGETPMSVWMIGSYR
ncbi:MAG: hypothetical protein C4521_08450 [Actinobacteria bacterium]|nr:MAG: hypothetical protein C4521_08450 [Actinomycetota bacterium]